MSVGGLDLTPEALAVAAAGFVAAGATLGILVAALGSMVDAIRH